MIGMALGLLMNLLGVGFPTECRAYGFDLILRGVGGATDGKCRSPQGWNELHDAPGIRNVVPLSFSIGNATSQESKIVARMDVRLGIEYMPWFSFDDYLSPRVGEKNAGIRESRIKLERINVCVAASILHASDLRRDKRIYVPPGNNCRRDVIADRRLVAYVFDLISDLGRRLPIGYGQIINNYRLNAYPRSLLSLNFAQSSAENPPLREADYDRGESEESYSNRGGGGTPTRPILGVFIFLIGLPLFVISLKIADAPYKPTAVACFSITVALSEGL